MYFNNYMCFCVLAKWVPCFGQVEAGLLSVSFPALFVQAGRNIRDPTSFYVSGEADEKKSLSEQVDILLGAQN